MVGELRFKFFRKVKHHHFAGWLVVYPNDFMASVLHFVGDFFVRGADIEYCGVVKRVYNLLIDNSFEVAKVYNHTIFDVSGVGNRHPDYGYVELITVTMYVFAQAVVTIKCMSGFKFKLLGNTNFFVHFLE